MDPYEWSDKRADVKSAAEIPSSGAVKNPATDVFCDVIGTGATALGLAIEHPQAAWVAAAALLVLAFFLASRTRWVPTAPLSVFRRRTVGQILSASGRLFLRHAPGFLALGLVTVPVSLASAGLYALAGLFQDRETLPAQALTVALVWAGQSVSVVVFTVICATVAAMARRIDAGDEPRPLSALRELSWRRLWWLVAFGTIVVVIGQLAASISSILLLVWIVALSRFLLFPAVMMLENDRGILHPAARSFALTTDHMRRSLVLLAGVTVAANLVGPAVGAAVLVFTGWPFWVANLVGAAVNAVSLAWAALVVTYAYSDFRAREPERNREQDERLPAEFSPAGDAAGTGSPAEEGSASRA